MRLDQLTRRQREILVTAHRRETGGRNSERLPVKTNQAKPYRKLVDEGLGLLDFRACGSFWGSEQPEFTLTDEGYAMVAAIKGRS